MPNILVRDVQPAVHSRLQERAHDRGQSLQQYLTTELKQLAETPTIEEVIKRIERRRGGRVGLAQAADDLAADRTQR